MRIPAAGLLCGAALAGWGVGGAAATDGPRIGERPIVESHLDQARINAGEVTFDELFEHGRLLFSARFNKLDGQGSNTKG